MPSLQACPDPWDFRALQEPSRYRAREAATPRANQDSGYFRPPPASTNLLSLAWSASPNRLEGPAHKHTRPRPQRISCWRFVPTHSASPPSPASLIGQNQTDFPPLSGTSTNQRAVNPREEKGPTHLSRRPEAAPLGAKSASSRPPPFVHHLPRPLSRVPLL